MKHLVLGSSGQIGCHLVEYLKSIGEDVIEYDIVLNKSYDLRYYDNDLLELIMRHCDYVHFLAFDVGGSVYLKKYQNTYEFIDNNVKIMNYTFSLLKKYDKPFTFASSQMSNMTYSTYGILKSIGERYTSALNGLTVKFWNVYGYEKDLEKSHVVTDFINMAKDGTIHMRTDGTELRQFLYGEDCAECLYILSKNYSKIERTEELHCTSFEWIDILKIANTIQSIIPCEVIPNTIKDEIQRDKQNNPSKNILNYWKPKTPLYEGINKIICKTF